MDTVIKLRLEKEDLKAELESARDNILYKAQTVWLPRAQESFRDLSSLAGDHLTNGTYSCALCSVADAQKGARLSHKKVSIKSYRRLACLRHHMCDHTSEPEREGQDSLVRNLATTHEIS